jgi:SsrA-binding protein
MAKDKKPSSDVKKADEIITIATNKKAGLKYEFFDKFEAGISLQGTEVKSLRDKQASLDEAFARPRGKEIYLVGMHIAPYEFGNRTNHDPKRMRKLLLHKAEIRKIAGRINERGFTLIPLRAYFRNGYAKVLIALARGRQKFDRREVIREREAKRDMERATRRRR